MQKAVSKEKGWQLADRRHEDVAGRELLTVAMSLPTEVVEAAQIRGQASDLWATVSALLVELEQG